MKPEDEIKTIDDAIALAVSRKADLVQLIKDQEKPKYEDGTPGYLCNAWEAVSHKGNLVNLINTDNEDAPYSGTYINSEVHTATYKNFTPLETAILGMKYRHEGGACPVSLFDHILKVYPIGSDESGMASGMEWVDRTFDYYIIKRHEG